VAQAVLNGIVQVSLETEVPVLSAVLTPQQFHETEAHVQFFSDHMLVKGKELAEACTSIVDAMAAVVART
jgi:6,7-dimethyl-8-ribityllumazine synthase